MAALSLFLIAATCSGTGENLDLFVRATDRENALDLWRKYYEREPEEEDDSVRVFQPLLETFDHETEPRALDWGEDVIEIE